jgi:heme A synthase
MTGKTAVFLFTHTLIYLLSILVLLLLVIAGVREEIFSEGLDTTGLVLLGVLFGALSLCIYTFIFQVRLKKTIKKNYRNKLEKMIDKIGEQ